MEQKNKNSLSLSSEELNQTLISGLEYYSNFINTKLSVIPFTDHIEVKNSLIHGKGVFATNFIKKGSLITLYPPHIIGLTNESKMHTGCLLPDVTVEELPEDYKFTSPILKFTLYGIPSQYSNKRLMGHMLNDAASIGVKEKSQLFLNKFTYIQDSLKNNCEFFIIDSYFVGIVSKRDILKGEELTVTYGDMYWFEKIFKLTSTERKNSFEKLVALDFQKKYTTNNKQQSIIEIIEKIETDNQKIQFEAAQQYQFLFKI